jgi:cytoskeletal protein CcmA (bactofilin family)
MTKLNFKLISIKGRINMFEKKSSTTDQTNTTEDPFNVLRPKKGSAKVVIGNGVKIKGEITDADEVQIDGSADVTMNTDNLMIGGTGDLKGTITSHNADVWGKLDGEVKVGGTLTIQELGSVSGSIEYENLQIKLGGKIKGDVKVSEKIKNIDDIKNINKEKPLPLQSSLDNKNN